MVGAEKSPLESLSKRVSDEFRYILININDFVNKKNINPLLKAIIQDIEYELKESVIVSSITIVKVIGLLLNIAKDKRILIEGFPRNKEDLDLWNKTKGEDCDTKCFIYVEISDDKVKEGVSNENTLKKCDFSLIQLNLFVKD